MNTARLLTDAWLVHYNFFKEHSSLGDIPPAQAMGIPVPFKDWNDVVRQTQDTPKRLIISNDIKQQFTTSTRHIRHKTKPKPKHTTGRQATATTITAMRMR